MALGEIIKAGLNDPNCAFFVGNFLGMAIALRWIVVLVFIYWIFSAANKLAFEPFIGWVKNKIYNKKLKGGKK